LQHQPVRKWTPERNAIGHKHVHFKRSKGVKLNGILEHNVPSKNRQRTPLNCAHPVFAAIFCKDDASILAWLVAAAFSVRTQFTVPTG